MTYISTSSLTSPLRLSVQTAQAALTQAQSEVSSGAYADVGLQLGGGTGQLLSLRSSVDSLNGYTATNSVASTRLSATDSALTSMLSTAQGLSATLTSAQSAGTPTTGLAASAQGALEGFIGQVNTSAGGQYVFGGIATQTTPIASSTATSTAVQSAFQTYLSDNNLQASSLTSQQMKSFIDSDVTPLFSGSAWSAASSQTMTTQIAPGQTTSTSVSANQSAFQNVAQAYTMLSQFTGDDMSAAAQSAVVSTAANLLSTGIAGLTNVQAGVGVAQDAIAQANTQISAQTTLLSSSASNLDSVDSYALSSQVTQLQTQLEASYSLTSRLQQLSLVNYLTAG